MKYEKEYKGTYTKEEFIRLCKKKYQKTKRATFLRRFYDMRRQLGAQKEVIEKNGFAYPVKFVERMNVEFGNDDVELTEPGYLKKLMLDDMKRFNQKINIPFLKKHGFSMNEIRWIKKEGWF